MAESSCPAVVSFTSIQPAHASPHASTLNTVVRQAANATAPAVATVVLTSRTAAGGGADAHPPVAAFQSAYLVLAVVSVAAAALAFTMADRDARNAVRTMPQRETANA
ncbi:hypothetical protein [Streptomyces sp. NPDC048438]|uniref:hypothetical protein n=1 Tax=Streptomyces sp. NPDC048438 TaxID=3365551 RepID=UPI003717EAEE